MRVSGACDWGRPSSDWPCAWTPSDYYRFLLSVSRNRFLSTDLQSAFWKRFGKEPSLGFQMDLTNLHALLNDQKAGSRSEWTSHQLAFRLLHTRHQRLTDGLGPLHSPLHSPRIPSQSFGTVRPALRRPVPKSSYCLERRAHTLFAARISEAYSLQYPGRKSAWGGSAFGRYDVGQ